MNPDLVSIIMPAYNSADYISESIESVIQQDYKNWELLIADDNSSDKTIDVINGFAKRDERVKILPSNQNSGPAVTRNRAIEAAKGRYIAFLDSDDLWVTNKLTKQINFMKKGNIALSYALFETIDEHGNTIKAANNKLPDKVNYNDLLKNPIIGCLTAIYDTELCGKQKMPVIRKRQDFALWLRILKQGHEAACCKNVLGFYRVRKGSVSRNKFQAMRFNWRLYRKIEKLPLPNALWVFGWYVFNKTFR